ncbi:MAG: hypothetical protein M3N59_02390 [bacterium]|nr:hypothetical protein [bacterium]
MIVEQRQQLTEADRLMRDVLADDAVLIPSEYANPIEGWLETQQRRLPQ